MHRTCSQLLFAVVLSSFVFASAPVLAGPIGAGLSRTFENLPPERVESGILYDRVLGLSRIEEHDGLTRFAPAGLPEWRQIYFEMRNASLSEPAWPSLEAVVARDAEAVRRGTVPIAVMNFRYEKIRRNALETGALEIQGEHVVLGQGDPFLPERVFAAAPLREHTYRGGRVEFRLDRRDYFSNDAAAPRIIDADFDDGRGFVPLAFDETHAVTYGSPGTKTVVLRFGFDNAMGLEASFPFEVLQLAAPAPNDTLHITATVPYLGQLGHGDAYVYLAPEHSVLTNPVIVLEGFDLDNSMNWDELYALLNQEGLLETLRSMGYDAVVMNFLDSTDYIQRNAMAVVELIEEVDATVASGQTSPVVGASLGGLAGRYALTYMEANGLPHRVRNFISFDAPQSGADIPLGVQYWLDFFKDQSADAAALLAALDSPAARQLLVYHHTTPAGSTGQADPLRATIMNELTALGSYPAAHRKVAIANGSGSMQNQGFNPGDQLIRWEYSNLFVSITGNVWALPNVTSHDIFHGYLRILLFPSETTVTVSGTRPFDGAPGGSRASLAEMDAVPAPYGDIIALHPNHCFIPTVSSLDLATQDLFYNIAGDPDLLASSPFDAVYFPQQNQEHVLVTPENKQWVIAEIETGATTGVPAIAAIPGVPSIMPAAPNPFSETATVRFTLPAAGMARLAVFDASGRQVAVIAEGRFEAGEHSAEWRGTDASGRRAASGVYFVELRGGDFATSRKVVLE